MILLLFFSFCSTFLHTAEMSGDFITLRKHIEQCPVDCTKKECAQKGRNIKDPWYKNIFKQVYCTYHCISEIPSEASGLSIESRYFINFYGEFLTCKRSATNKEELILFRRDKTYIDYNLGNTLNDCSQIHLDTIKPPIVNAIRAKNVDDSVKECVNPSWIELCCCVNQKYPSDVINLIGRYIYTNYRPVYLYSFFYTGYSLKKFVEREKRWLFSIIESKRLEKTINNWNYKQEQLIKQSVSGRKELPESERCSYVIEYNQFIFFPVAQLFTITELHSGIDFYNNGGTRVVLECEQEKGIFFKQKEVSLLTIPHEKEYGACNHGRMCLGLKTYNVTDIEQNHQMLKKGVKGIHSDKNPLDCYCSQSITGPSEKVKKYLQIALKRIEIKTSCLHKNEAASTSKLTVYNNSYGQFVIHQDGKPVVLDAYMRHCYGSQNAILYYAVHTDKVLDDNAMKTLARQYAERWKRAPIYENNGYRSEYIYCYEENPSEIFALSYPYGDVESWRGHWSSLGHNIFYNQDKDIDLRDGGIKTFHRYRLWMLSVSELQTEISAFLDRRAYLDLYMVYTDWPYEIAAQKDSHFFTLSHEKSDYCVSFKINYCYMNKGPYVKIDLEGHSTPTSEKQSTLLLTYTYKDRDKFAQFKKRQQSRNQDIQNKKHVEESQRKLQKEQEMGFTKPALSSVSDYTFNGNSVTDTLYSAVTQSAPARINIFDVLQKSTQFFSFLRRSMPAIPAISIKVGLFGQGVMCGFTLGAGIVGMLWYLKDHQILHRLCFCRHGKFRVI